MYTHSFNELTAGADKRDGEPGAFPEAFDWTI